MRPMITSQRNVRGCNQERKWEREVLSQEPREGPVSREEVTCPANEVTDLGWRNGHSIVQEEMMKL